MRPQSFQTLSKFSLVAKSTESGWVQYSDIAMDESNCYKIIQRIKEELKIADVNTNLIIENDGSKRYRLSVPRTIIQIEKLTILNNVLLGETLKSELQKFQEEAPRIAG